MNSSAVCSVCAGALSASGMQRERERETLGPGGWGQARVTLLFCTVYTLLYTSHAPYSAVMFFFFFHSMRVKGFSDKANKRNILFYLLFPFMVLYALIAIPITLLFSLGDLNEEPNNHLVLATKNVQKDDATKTDDII